MDKPDFTKQIDKSAFQVQGADQLQQQGDDIKKAEAGVGYDWSKVNALLDQASGYAKKYVDQAATGESVYEGQEARLHQQNLNQSNVLSPASIGQALLRMSANGSAQAGQVGAAQLGGEDKQMQKGLAEQQEVMQQRAAMMDAELKLQAQKAAITQSVAQVQQGLSLAVTHMSNMYNNAVASASNASQYAALQADQQSFQQIMDYVKAGMGAAATATAAGANYLKANPGSPFAMALNPNNVWSSSNNYNSGQYANPVVYGADGSTNSVAGNGTYGGATDVTGVGPAGAGDAGGNIG